MNYLSESTHPNLNLSARITHVLHDNHYWAREHDVPKNVSQTIWRRMNQQAIDYLIEPVPEIQAIVQWSRGFPTAKECGSNWEKEVAAECNERFAMYSSLVSGSRGVMFWFLSKSGPDSFALAEQLAEEAEVMAPYLLTDHPSSLDNATLTHNINIDNEPKGEAVEFLVRKLDDANGKSALVIIVNASDDTDTGSSAFIKFPSSWDIESIESVIPGYQWSYVFDDAENGFSIGVADWYARAFIVRDY